MSAMRALLLGSYSKRSTTAVSSLWEREKSTCDIQGHTFGVRLLLTHLERPSCKAANVQSEGILTYWRSILFRAAHMPIREQWVHTAASCNLL